MEPFENEVKHMVNSLELYKRSDKTLASLQTLVNGLYHSFISLYGSLPDDFYSCWADTWGLMDQTLADAEYKTEVFYERMRLINEATEELINCLLGLISDAP